MNKKGIITITAIIVALGVLGGAGTLFYLKQKEAAREKTIALATSYFENKEYVKALAILETLLATNGESIEVSDMINKIEEAKEIFEEAEKIKKEANVAKEQKAQEERILNSLLETQKDKEEEDLKNRVDELLKEAVDAIKNNQLKEAETFRKEVLKLDPNNNQAIKLKKEITDKEKSLENEKQKAERLAKEKEAAELVKQAEESMKSNVFNAETLFNKALLLNPDNVEALKGLADISILNAKESDTDIPKAINRILNVLQEEPKNTEYLNELADLYSRKNEFKKELETLNALLKIEENADFLVRAGIAAYKLDRFDEALVYFNKAITKDSKFPGIYYPLALTYEKKGNNSKRENMLKTSLSLRPDHAASYYELGRYYTDVEEFDKALVLFLKAKEINDSSVKYKMGVALAYYNLEEYLKAVDIYESIIRIDQSISEVYYNLSMARIKLEEYDQALTDISFAIKLKPASSTYLYTIGLISEELNKEDKAISYYLNSLKIDPTYYKPMLNLGNIYDKQGKY
ncbi:MAG: tetratricopeptide repeat protein, partial [Spirochaetales bacterium]|nr:tetratricopeptide repeat protein [Spirochaetales bacterium]